MKKRVGVTSENIIEEATISNISGTATPTWSIYQCRLSANGRSGVRYVLLYISSIRSLRA